MSMDFVTSLTSKQQDLGNALTIVNLVLTQHKAHCGESIVRGDTEGLMGHVVEDEEISIRSDVAEVRNRMADWRDVTVEYHFERFTTYVQLVSWQAGFLNTFIQVDLRQIRKMHKEDKLLGYHRILANLGLALGARGGLGGVEFPVEPLAPNQLPQAIVARSAPLGLMSASEANPGGIFTLASKSKYKIEIISGFYILTNDLYPVPST